MKTKLSVLLVVMLGACVLAQAAPAADVWITSGPSGVVKSTKATFKFTGPKRTTFSCRLDGGVYKACKSPKTYKGLGQGDHTFNLKNSGSPHIDTRTWTVDTVAPAPPVIVSGPSGTVNSTTATFAFTGEAGATFLCKLGAGPGRFAACTSPKTYGGLVEGNYVFQVKQRDLAGNLGAPAGRTWTIDTTPPDAPTLTPTINGANASFAFSGEPGATFKCALDDAALAACTSPQTYTGLPDGQHTFHVRQYDAAGNESPAATHTWTVATPPPAPTVESIAASCSGDTLQADAIALGTVGTEFTMTLYQSTAGSEFAATDGTATVTLTSADATHYLRSFDISTLVGDSFKVVSSTGVESAVVLRSACGPGGTIPEAPDALMLPLSILGTLALSFGLLYVRRRIRRS